jgi:hypothetical protein
MNAGRADPVVFRFQGNRKKIKSLQVITSLRPATVWFPSVTLVYRPLGGAAPCTLTFLMNSLLHFSFLDSLSFSGTERS